jgi:spermidine synthase
MLIAVSFLCGATGLVYELVWSRYLGLVFGVSAHAVATVLAVFMAGLAVGSWHWGRRIDLAARPVRTLRRLCLGVAAYVAVSPLVYRALVAISHSVLPALAGGPLRATARVLLSLLVLFIPTYLMGGCLPVLVKLRAAPDRPVRRAAAEIYGANTLGGAVGAFATGFLLVRWLGLSWTLEVAAALSLIGALLAFLVRMPSPTVAPTIRGGKEVSALDTRAMRLALIVFALSGFTSLAYEVYWTRILTFFFRDSIYDFAIVLTTFLTGLVVGSVICGRLRMPRPIRSLAAAEIGIGLTSLLALYLINQFPFILNDLQTNTALRERYGDAYWTAALVLRFAYAFAVLLVPTVFFGATFPLMASIYASNAPTVGRRLGLATGINTLGSTVGALLAGFAFIALLGLQNAIVATALVNVGGGVALAAISEGRGRKALIATAVAATAAAIVLLPTWDRLRMSTAFLDPHQSIGELLSLVFYSEDAVGMTSVVDLVPLRRKYLVTNRMYVHNTSDMLGLEDHRRLGHIPMLLHAAPRRVLVVGLGAGISLRGIAAFDAQDIDVAELSPGVVKAARFFAQENGGVLDDTRVHTVVDDGRSFISLNAKTYDVIVGDILFPMSSGSTNLSSREYFELVRAHLAPGGIYCQWYPLHQLELDELRTIARTFQSVFPEASLWYGMIGDSVPVVGCIGGREKLSLDVARLAAPHGNAALDAELREVDLHSAPLLLSHLVMGPAALSRFADGASINTDDRPVIELLAPRHALRSGVQGVLNLAAIDPLREDVEGYLRFDDLAAGTRAETLRQIRRYVAGKSVAIQGLRQAVAGDREGQRLKYHNALGLDPQNEDLQWFASVSE